MCIVQNKSFCCTSGCLDLISLSFGGYERILDWFTIFVYCKSLEGCFPFVVCSKFYFLTCGCITCIEFCFYKLRTLSILVVCVIPVYRYCNVNTFWCVAVCNCESVFCSSCCFLSILCTKIRFFYSVLDRLTSFLKWKVVPCLGPLVICCVNYDLGANSFAISFKL